MAAQMNEAKIIQTEAEPVFLPGHVCPVFTCFDHSNWRRTCLFFTWACMPHVYLHRSFKLRQNLFFYLGHVCPVFTCIDHSNWGRTCFFLPGACMPSVYLHRSFKLKQNLFFFTWGMYAQCLPAWFNVVLQQCPRLAPVVHGPQIVWACVCVCMMYHCMCL